MFADTGSHQGLQLLQVALIDRPGLYLMLLADRGRHTDHFTHHAGRSHHTYRTQGHMRHTNVSSGHEQIVHIARIETTVGNRIGIDVDVLGNRLELPLREIFRILRIGIVQIDTPSGCSRTILMHHMPTQVILLQDVIAQQTTGLPFARHVSHPTQLPVLVGTILLQLVLQVAPVGIDHQQTIIPDLFKVMNLVPVHTRLPRPFAHGHLLAILLVEFHPIVEIGKMAGAFRIFGIPLDRGTHRHGIGLLRSCTLAKLISGFTTHPVVCTGQIADRSIARTVRKEGSLQTKLLATLNVLDHHPLDGLSRHLYVNRPIVGKERDVRFARHNGRLLVIFIKVGRLGIATSGRSKLLLQVAQLLVGTRLNAAAQMDTHLRTVVATQDGPVIHQGHLTAQTGCRDSRTNAGNATTYDHQIETALLRRHVGQLKRLPTESRQLLWIRRRQLLGICREIDGITTAIKTGQVVQPEDGLLLTDRHFTSHLPHPLLPLGTQGRGQFLATHTQAELARALPLLPGSGPVIGTYIDVIITRFRKIDRCLGILHRGAHPMGQQIGRAHQIHKLLIDHPSAFVGKALCLYQQVSSLGGQTARQ